MVVTRQSSESAPWRCFNYIFGHTRNTVGLGHGVLIRASKSKPYNQNRP